MTVTAYIALGSNLGDREKNLDGAVELLRSSPGITVKRVSSYYETEPVGGPSGQNSYLNAAAKLETRIEPGRLLEVLLQTEKQLGRVRAEKNAPRTIDLDLLLYDDVVSTGPDLILPHPRMHERLFVLEPLAEIAPNVVHPLLDCTPRDLMEILYEEEDLVGAWEELQQIAAERAELQTEKQEPQSREQVLSLREREQSLDGRARALFAQIEVGQDRLARLRKSSRGAVPRMIHKFLDRDLARMRALVTGSTSGIGLAIALELAAAGARVIIHGRRLSAVNEVEKRMSEQIGRRCAFMVADLRRDAECERLVRCAWPEADGLDIWINNAGADTLTGEAADWPFERK